MSVERALEDIRAHLIALIDQGHHPVLVTLGVDLWITFMEHVKNRHYLGWFGTAPPTKLFGIDVTPDSRVEPSFWAVGYE